MRSNNLLLREVVLVLVLDSQMIQFFKLFALDAFHLEAFVLQFLAYLATFFKIVQPFLLACFLVLRNLLPIQIVNFVGLAQVANQPVYSTAIKGGLLT